MLLRTYSGDLHCCGELPPSAGAVGLLGCRCCRVSLLTLLENDGFPLPAENSLLVASDCNAFWVSSVRSSRAFWPPALLGSELLMGIFRFCLCWELPTLPGCNAFLGLHLASAADAVNCSEHVSACCQLDFMWGAPTCRVAGLGPRGAVCECLACFSGCCCTDPSSSLLNTSLRGVTAH